MSQFLNTSEKVDQLATFFVDGEMFGIEVMKVQEVAREPKVHPVPLAPRFVRGLANLRGQIATAIGLREAFCKEVLPEGVSQMSVVCKLDGNLVSLIVDGIGDVVEVSEVSQEAAPDTIHAGVKKYIKSVYKMNGGFLSLLDLERIGRDLSPTNENKTDEGLA